MESKYEVILPDGTKKIVCDHCLYTRQLELLEYVERQVRPTASCESCREAREEELHRKRFTVHILVKSGLSIADTARKLGIRYERARQRYHTTENFRKRPEFPSEFYETVKNELFGSAKK